MSPTTKYIPQFIPLLSVGYNFLFLPITLLLDHHSLTEFCSSPLLSPLFPSQTFSKVYTEVPLALQMAI